MARARLIKPSFFTNDKLAELPAYNRLLFIGLWTLADREGRLEDRTRRIKAELFPYDNVNVEKGLTQLQDYGFIARYEVGQARFIQVVAFTKHQSPHPKEIPSTIPPPEGHSDSRYPGGVVDAKTRAEVFARDGSACLRCGSTTDLTVDHVVPQYEGGSHDSSNLQTLCRGCNAGKGRRMDESSMAHASTMLDASNPTFSGTDPAGSSGSSGSSVLPIPIAGSALAVAENTAAAETEPTKIGLVMDAWTNATGQTITALMADQMEHWIEKAGDGWVLDAIRETGIANVRSWKYTSAILERWVRDGRDWPPEERETVTNGAMTVTELEAAGLKKRYKIHEMGAGR